MKFLVLTQYFAPEIGASQVRLASFCRELAQAGHSVEIVTAMPHHPVGRIFPGYENQFYRREDWEGIPLHRVWLYAANGSNFKRILGYGSFALTCLFGLARASKPDFIFVDSPPPFLGVPGWLAAKWWRVPLIFNVADLWPDSVRDLGILGDGLALKFAYWLERWIYRHSDVVTAVTEGIHSTLLEAKGLPLEKVLFLPNGVDTDLFQPQPPDEIFKDNLGLAGKRVILYAGNHGYAGAVEQILYAANLLREDPSVHFLLIGEGSEKAKLMEMAERMSLPNLTFLGQVPLESMPAFLSISEIAVITLRKSQVMAGARPAKSFVMMAAGKPIALAAEGEAARLIESAGSGLVVPFEDHEALTGAIVSLLRDPAGAAEMGRNGRKFVIENFKWSSLVRNWLEQLSGVFPAKVGTKGDFNDAGTEKEIAASLWND